MKRCNAIRKKGLQCSQEGIFCGYCTTHFKIFKYEQNKNDKSLSQALIEH